MSLFAPFVAVQEQPWLGLIPAVLLLVLWVVSRLRLVLSTSALWLLYTGYEAAMAARVLCSGECNIRIDLLLIGPILIGLSAAALLVFAWWAVKHAWSPGA